jgi:hypothetical protein
MLVDVGDDAAVLAGAELIPLVHPQHEVALGNLQAGFERAGVPNLVHVDLGGAAHRLDALRFVVEVIPAFRVVHASDHVDAICRHHEVAVVEVVLLRREDVHHRARLLPRVWRLG